MNTNTINIKIFNIIKITWNDVIVVYAHEYGVKTKMFEVITFTAKYDTEKKKWVVADIIEVGNINGTKIQIWEKNLHTPAIYEFEIPFNKRLNVNTAVLNKLAKMELLP